MMRRTDRPVVIVGAGLAGLACARALRGEQVPVIILDASDGVGGRVRTDRVEADGGAYQIDRGFQVYLTAYPEGRRVLRIPALDLRSFIPGAMVRFEGRFWRIADPLRAPLALLGMLRSPLMTTRDAPALAILDTSLRLASEARCWNAPEQTTEELLHGFGISVRAIDRIFRPFFGGVFLDRSLKTSARKFRSTYRMFARGRASLPAAGMQAISGQLASLLDSSALRTGQVVSCISPGEVTLASGETLHASAIVVAADRRRRGKAPARRAIASLEGDGIAQLRRRYAPVARADSLSRWRWIRTSQPRGSDLKRSTTIRSLGTLADFRVGGRAP